MTTQIEAVQTITTSLTRVQEMNIAISDLATKYCDYDWSKLVELREGCLDILPGIRSRMRKLYPADMYVDQFALYARYYESAINESTKPNITIEQITACNLLKAIASYVMYVKV